MSATTGPDCPPWCTNHSVDKGDGTQYHRTEEVEYPIAGWYHLVSVTGGGQPDEPPIVAGNPEGEWTPEDALKLAERFLAGMRELAVLARPDCPPWCIVVHDPDEDEKEGAAYHSAEDVQTQVSLEPLRLTWVEHLNGRPDGVPVISLGDVEWAPDDALKVAAEFSAGVNALVDQALKTKI